jgi:hypothetical protein
VYAPDAVAVAVVDDRPVGETEAAGQKRASTTCSVTVSDDDRSGQTSTVGQDVGAPMSSAAGMRVSRSWVASVFGIVLASSTGAQATVLVDENAGLFRVDLRNNAQGPSRSAR